MKLQGLPGDFKKPALLVLVVAIVLVMAGGYATARKTVEIQVDGKLITLATFGPTVGQVLEEAGVSLGEKDLVEPGPSTSIVKNMRITVTRAVPVRIFSDGRRLEVWTTETTVEGVVRQAGIELGERDKLLPDPASKIQPGMDIKVVRVTQELVVETRRIPFKTIHRPDASLEVGLRKTIQQGRDGISEVTLQVTYEDGVKVNVIPVEERLIKPPVEQIVATGTINVVSRGGHTIRFKRALEMVATAYYPGPESTGPYADGYTAIGLKAGRGIVAVDPKVIPLRSRLYIEGYGYALAGDVGGAIKGYRIDLGYDTLQEAIRWGRRKVKVYVLAE